LFRADRFEVIVHCAGQPSHDKSRDILLLDFEINALGTINLLVGAKGRPHLPHLEHGQVQELELEDYTRPRGYLREMVASQRSMSSSPHDRAG
jgi:nucleoside-diphosphate-sugar epimerase